MLQYLFLSVPVVRVSTWDACGPGKAGVQIVSAVLCLAPGTHLINPQGSQGRGRRGSEEDPRQHKGHVSVQSTPSQPQHSGGGSAPPLLSAAPLSFIFKATFDLVYKHVQLRVGDRSVGAAPGQGNCPPSQIKGQRQSLTSLESHFSSASEWSPLLEGPACLLWLPHSCPRDPCLLLNFSPFSVRKEPTVGGCSQDPEGQSLQRRYRCLEQQQAVKMMLPPTGLP